MSEYDLDVEIFDMPDEVPEYVLEAAAAHIATAPRGLWKPKRAAVEEFFSGVVELIKQAQGHDGGIQ